MGFDSMELDIPGPEGETTLGEVLGGIILWDKNNIKLQARRQGQHRLRVVAGHHHLQEAHPKTMINTARVHLDLRGRTWVSRLRRRLCQLRTISGSVIRR